MRKTILVEVGELFYREKIYFFLLVCVVLFYGAIFFIHRPEGKEPLASQKLERIEILLREAPQKPQVIQERLAGHPELWWAVQWFTFFFIGAFGLGIWFAAQDLWRWFLKKELIPAASAPPLNISWGVSEVVKVLILFFCAGIFLNFLTAFLRLFFGAPLNSSNLILGHTLLLDVAAVCFIVSFVQKRGAQLRDLVGFNFLKFPLREVWWGFRTYFAIFPVFVGILLLLVFLASRWSYEPPPHPLVKVLLKEEPLSPWTVGYVLLVACVVGPAIEEIFFRGFFYPALRKYWGPAWTTTATALLFAGVHENIFSFLPIFFLGLVLCYLYEKRSNLISCISLHMLHNTAFIIYFFLVKNVLFASGTPP